VSAKVRGEVGVDGCARSPTVSHEGRDSSEEDPVGKSKIAKKVDKLEKEADKLRKKAEKKGKELQSQASDRIDDLSDEISGKQKKSSKKGVFALLLAAGAGVAAFVMKKKRDQELDEALWEEPRSI
jgi:hypothetical protein